MLGPAPRPSYRRTLVWWLYVCLAAGVGLGHSTCVLRNLGPGNCSPLWWNVLHGVEFSQACQYLFVDVDPRQLSYTLRKYAYSNIKKISPPKTENFQVKKTDIFHISAQNIDRGYSLEPPSRDGSNEYPQSMFWAEIRKIMYTPVNPSFTI